MDKFPIEASLAVFLGACGPMSSSTDVHYALVSHALPSCIHAHRKVTSAREI